MHASRNSSASKPPQEGNTIQRHLIDRGGVFVNLTKDNQHVEFTYVDTVASQNYKGFCGVAFDVPARRNTSQPIVANPGNCTQGPTTAPYSSSAISPLLRSPYQISKQASMLAGTM